MSGSQNPFENEAKLALDTIKYHLQTDDRRLDVLGNVN